MSDPWTLLRFIEFGGIFIGVPMAGAGLSLLIIRGGAVLRTVAACALLLLLTLSLAWMYEVTSDFVLPGMTPQDLHRLRLRR